MNKNKKLILISSAMMLACLALSASGQILTVQSTAVPKGAVVLRGYPADNSCLQVYSPPNGYKLKVTDFQLDSYGSPTAIPFQYICTGTPTCSVAQSAYMTAPAAATFSASLLTGISVPAGQTLSVCNYGGNGKTVSWTLRGYLYQ